MLSVFSECVDVFCDFYAFPFCVIQKICTRATREISVTALIFGYISRYAVLLLRFGEIIPLL